MQWARAALCRGTPASSCPSFSCCRAPDLGHSGFSGCGTQAELPRGMWDLPGSGIKPMSPALAGGFFQRTIREVLLLQFMSKSVLPVFFEEFYGLGFTCRSLIHFELTFFVGVIRKSRSLIVIYILNGERACVSPALLCPGPGAGPECCQGPQVFVD